MAPVDVFGALVVFWIVRKVNGGLVVQGKRCRPVAAVAQVSEKCPEVYGLFGGLAGCHDLCLARREGDRCLLLR
eukprot:449772-Pleurochrysis_carterae.AAC.1